jgi:hypothetical protein
MTSEIPNSRPSFVGAAASVVALGFCLVFDKTKVLAQARRSQRVRAPVNKKIGLDENANW